MKTTRLLAAFLLVVSVSSLAAPTKPYLQHLFDLPLHSLVNQKVSGPTRTLKSMSITPASVTVFTQNELQKLGIDFLYELLNYAPGFQTSRDNDAGASYIYSARGSDSSQGTTAILLLVDGIPRQEIRSGSASVLSGLMPIERIQHIEFIRGPGSALYGSSAFLGIINIITVKDANTIHLQSGDFDHAETQIQLSKEVNQWKFDGYLSLYKDNGDNFVLDDRISDVPTKTSDPQSAENVAISASFANFILRMELLQLKSEDFYSIGVINNRLNEQEHKMSTVSLEQKLSWQDVNSRWLVSYGNNRLDYIAQGTAPGRLTSISAPNSEDPLVGDVSYASEEWNFQWFNNWTLSQSSSLQFGFEGRHEHIKKARVLANFDTQALANREFPIQSSDSLNIYTQVTDTLSRELFGLYLQHQYQWNANTNITMGMRYDDYDHLDSQTSIRVALVRLLNETDSLKLFYGEAYRAPSLVQLDSTENVTEAPNPDLGAETIYTTELVWLTQRQRFSFSASAFYNVIDDRIDSSGFIDDKQSTVNQSKEYSNGFEIESSLHVADNWLVRMGITRFTKLPTSSLRESEQLASIIVNYQHYKWWANVSGYYNSERQMPNGATHQIDDFLMLSAKLGYQISKELVVNLQAKNIFDEEVTSAPQRLDITSPIPYRGREISLGFSYEF
ncbi:MAG: TonB-dependent receptor [Pseudomonadales bacterium]|nr:TonB-dependent receptor [Pseudomonadales bacterium]